MNENNYEMIAMEENVNENEIYEGEIVDVDAGSNISTVAAMAIGAGLVCAGGALIKLGKWGVAKLKARKDQKKYHEQDFVVEGKVVEIKPEDHKEVSDNKEEPEK